MDQLLVFGLLCAFGPCLLAGLHFILRWLTRPLIYLQALCQALIVPFWVAMDPDISFGSDTYSLGAGVAIALIITVEFVFLIGTAAGLLAATSYVNWRERRASLAKLKDIYAELDAHVPASALGSGRYDRRHLAESSDVDWRARQDSNLRPEA